MTDTVATTIVYHGLSPVQQVDFPGNKTIIYWYDAAGDRTRLFYTEGVGYSVGYDYAPGHRVITVTEPSAWGERQTAYSYDNAGKVSRVDLPNGVWSEYTYDNASRLTGIAHQKVGSTLQSFSYLLDAVGNRTQMTDLAGGVTSYQYDPLYRLTQVTYPDRSVTTYSYDGVGNRLSLNGTTHTYDDADQLTSRSDGTTFGYDANGNQTSRSSDTLTYDHENRLTGGTLGIPSIGATYNGDGLRMSYSYGGDTASYVWDVAAGLPVVLQDGSHHYFYGLGRISSVNDATGAPTYYLYDGLGSVTGLTDGSGNLVATYGYDAFGAIRQQTGSSSNYWGYTGEQRDAGICLTQSCLLLVNACTTISPQSPLGDACVAPTQQSRICRNRYCLDRTTPALVLGDPSPAASGCPG